MSLWALFRGIQDFLDIQVQKAQRGTLESLVPSEVEAYVVLKETLVFQDAEVWLVQNAEFNYLQNIWMLYF